MPPVNFCRESPGTRLPPLDRMREPVRRRAARALALLLAVGATRAAQIFVSPSGHDTHGDGSEASPFRSVQAAVDAALDFGERALARLPRARRCSARTLTGVPARCHRAHGRRACVRHGDPVPAAQACGARPARAQHAHWGVLAGAHRRRRHAHALALQRHLMVRHAGCSMAASRAARRADVCLTAGRRSGTPCSRAATTRGRRRPRRCRRGRLRALTSGTTRRTSRSTGSAGIRCPRARAATMPTPGTRRAAAARTRPAGPWAACSASTAPATSRPLSLVEPPWWARALSSWTAMRSFSETSTSAAGPPATGASQAATGTHHSESAQS